MVRMDITPYVDSLRRDLVSAAGSAGDDVRAAADRLAQTLEPATRLALMEALSQAAAEITAELPSGSVEVRLHGRDLDFVVTGPMEPTTSLAGTAPSRTDEADDDGALARVTLRLPEAVKTRAEELAARRGQSLNTFLVAAVRAATSHDQGDVDLDLSSFPFDGDPFAPRKGSGNRRMTGWV